MKFDKERISLYGTAAPSQSYKDQLAAKLEFYREAYAFRITAFDIGSLQIFTEFTVAVEHQVLSVNGNYTVQQQIDELK